MSRRADALEVLGLLLLALAIRLALLVAPAADLIGVNEQGRPLDFHGEEYSRGNIAAEILRGPLLAILDYQWSPGFGGSLVMGLLAIPAFLLFGETLFALKLVPVAFGLLLVLACHRTALALGGRAAARAAGLLAAVAWPGLLAFQTIAWGVHAEVAALTALFGWLSVRALAAERPGAGLRFAQGLVGGFALYFGLGSALFLLPVALLELLRRRGALLARSSLAGALGFVVGFLPWIVYNARHGLVGTRQYDQSLAEQFSLPWEVLPARIVGVWTRVLPAGLSVRESAVEFTSAPTWPLYAALLLPVLVALVALVRRRQLEAGWILVAHVLLFTVVSAASRYYPSPRSTEFVDFRYTCLIAPSLVVLAGLGLAALWRRPSAARRALALLLLATFVVTSAVGTARLVDRSRTGTFLERGGSHVAGHGRWLVMRYAHDVPRIAAALARAEQRRTPEERAELYLNLAQTLAFLETQRAAPGHVPTASDDDYRRVHAWLREHAPPEHRPLFSGARAGGARRAQPPGR